MKANVIPTRRAETGLYRLKVQPSKKEKEKKKKMYRIQKIEGKLQVLLLYRYVSATSIGAD